MNSFNTEDCLYFAYGSNMSLKQMDERFVEGPVKLKNLDRWSADSLELEKVSSLGKGIVKDYELSFHKKKMASDVFEGFATISPKSDSQVEGVVYQLGKLHLDVLDFYEGVSNLHYIPEKVSVEICGTNEIKEAVGAYLNKLISGATEFQLSADVIQKLTAWETI